jgi:hypothetical protein
MDFGLSALLTIGSGFKKGETAELRNGKTLELCSACAASRYSRRRPTGSQSSAAPATFSIATYWRNNAAASALGCEGEGRREANILLLGHVDVFHVWTLWSVNASPPRPSQFCIADMPFGGFFSKGLTWRVHGQSWHPKEKPVHLRYVLASIKKCEPHRKLC